MTINQLIQVNTYEKKNGKKEKTINLPLMRERERITKPTIKKSI